MAAFSANKPNLLLVLASKQALKVSEEPVEQAGASLEERLEVLADSVKLNNSNHQLASLDNHSLKHRERLVSHSKQACLALKISNSQAKDQAYSEIRTKDLISLLHSVKSLRLVKVSSKTLQGACSDKPKPSPVLQLRAARLAVELNYSVRPSSSRQRWEWEVDYLDNSNNRK